jgi:3-keto steroid reductase
MSSLEAYPTFFDLDDWQLKKTQHSYETSKYQVDLVATTLDNRAMKEPASSRKRTRHFIAQPGVVSTNISKKLIGPALEVLKVMLFYMVRGPRFVLQI